MITALFNQPNYLAVKKMLDATVLRQQAIASNIANAETPNYKRLEVAPSFQTELRQALAARSPDQVAALQPRLQSSPRRWPGNWMATRSSWKASWHNWAAITSSTPWRRSW